MKLTEALSVVSTATEMRADMWREAANGYLAGSAELDCFNESGPEECNNMADLLDEAREVVDTFRENFNGAIATIEASMMENSNDQT